MNEPLTKYEMRANQLARKSRSNLAPVVRLICKVTRIHKVRSIAIQTICRVEGGQMWSRTYRELMLLYYGVHIGLHSYGPCLLPGRVPPGTRIGSYSSLAPGVVTLRRNHTIAHISQHPLFYNPSVGLADSGVVPEYADNPLTVGHDVWIGMNVLISPNCRTIGDSSIIAAGSVVTSNVPPFAIVGGVPAKLIRWRFSDPIREALTETHWWLKPVWELAVYFDLFTREADPTLVERLTSAFRNDNSET